MSYCSPRSISDYRLAKLLERSRADAEARSFGRARQGGLPRGVALAPHHHRAFHVGLDGELTALPHRESRDAPLDYAEPRTSLVDGRSGRVGRSTARFFPYDHAAGGELWVPEAPRGAASGQLSERAARLAPAPVAAACTDRAVREDARLLHRADEAVHEHAHSVPAVVRDHEVELAVPVTSPIPDQNTSREVDLRREHPPAPLFINTLTPPPPAATRSSLPSPLRSPNATELGVLPVG